MTSKIQPFIETEDDEETYVCENCGHNAPSSVALEKHKRIHQETEFGVDLKCGKCSETFSSIRSFKCHIQKHKIKQFACDLCPRVFRQKGRLIQHKQAHKQGKINVKTRAPKLWYCDVCKASFITRVALRKHWTCHPDVSESGFELSLRNQLTSKKGDFCCEYCGAKFPFESWLKNHSIKHTKEAQFMCEFCDQTFLYASMLYRHRRTHTGETPYHCKHCDAQFPSLDILNRHKAKHEGYKFDCPFCDKKFVMKGDMRNHIRYRHTEKRIYRCVPCSVIFTAVSSVKRHLLKFHENVENAEIHTRISTDPDSEFTPVDVSIDPNQRYKSKFKIRKDSENQLKQLVEVDDDVMLNTSGVTGNEIDDAKTVTTEVVANPNLIEENVKIILTTSNVADNETNEIQNVATEVASSSLVEGAVEGNVIAVELQEGELSANQLVVIQSNDGIEVEAAAAENAAQEMNANKAAVSESASANQVTMESDGSNAMELIANNHEIEIFMCEVCESLFYTQEEVDKHLATHNESEDSQQQSDILFECHFCNLGFTGSDDYYEHLTTVEMDKLHQCALCDVYFLSREELITHQCETHQETQYHCQECDVWISTEDKFGRHMAEHNRNARKTIVAPESSIEIIPPSQQIMPSHLSYKSTEQILGARRKGNESGEVYSFYKAPVDSKRFGMVRKSQGYLNKGAQDISEISIQIRMDKALGRNECEICEATFTEERYLEQHLATHRGHKKHECLICGFSFQQQRTLNKHLQRHTEEDRLRFYGQPVDINETAQAAGQIITTESAPVPLEQVEQISNEFTEQGAGDATRVEEADSQNVTDADNDFENACSFCEVIFTNEKDLMQHIHENHIEITDSSGVPETQEDNAADTPAPGPIPDVSPKKEKLEKKQTGYESPRKVMTKYVKKIKSETPVDTEEIKTEDTSAKDESFDVEIKLESDGKILQDESETSQIDNDMSLDEEEAWGAEELQDDIDASQAEASQNDESDESLYEGDEDYDSAENYEPGSKKRKQSSQEKKRKIPRLEEEQTEFKCAYCSEVFETRKDMYKHTDVCRDITGDKKPSVPKAALDFLAKMKRQNAVKNKQKERRETMVKNGRFECSKCDRVCNTWVGLRHHELQKHSGAQFPCDQCERIFNSRIGLISHRQKKHEGKIRKEVCQQCGKLVIGIPMSVHNQIVHTVRPKVIHECKDCGIVYKQAISLKRHISEVHLGVPVYKKEYQPQFHCTYCGKGFAFKSHFEKHQSVHMEIKPKPFACQYCPKSFARKSVRDIHVRVHMGELPYACTHCDEAFPQRDQLVRHEVKHTGLTHQCKECGKEFPIKNELKQHIKNVHQVHLESDMRFACRVCKKRFWYKCSRGRHEKNLHGIENPDDY